MRKRHGPLRADTLAIPMNAGKQRTVLGFIRDYRALVVKVARVQWREFFEAGATNKHAPATHLNGICGAAPVQMASYQVQEQIDGWVSNRANEFTDVVRGSKLIEPVKKQLYTVNRRKLWFSRDAIDGIEPAILSLARSIMRRVMSNHRRPDLSRVSPRLDARIASVAEPTRAKHASLWARLALPHRGVVSIPLLAGKQFLQRGGERCPVVQLCAGEGGSVSMRLVQDMAKPFAALPAAYEPRIDRLGLDFGLSPLLADQRRHPVRAWPDRRPDPHR